MLVTKTPLINGISWKRNCMNSRNHTKTPKYGTVILTMILLMFKPPNFFKAYNARDGKSLAIKDGHMPQGNSRETLI